MSICFICSLNYIFIENVFTYNNFPITLFFIITFPYFFMVYGAKFIEQFARCNVPCIISNYT